MTPCEVSETGPGTLRLACGRIGGKKDLAVVARFDARLQQATVERIALDDPSLTSSWGDHLNRIVLTPREAVQKGTWTLTIAKQSRDSARVLPEAVDLASTCPSRLKPRPPSISPLASRLSPSPCLRQSIHSDGYRTGMLRWISVITGSAGRRFHSSMYFASRYARPAKISDGVAHRPVLEEHHVSRQRPPRLVGDEREHVVDGLLQRPAVGAV